MSSILSMAAALLSLSAPSNYVFTAPCTTNLSGVGMGTAPSNAVPRLEDVAFLREAVAERAVATHEYFFRDDYGFPSGGFALDAGAILWRPDSPWFMWPLSAHGWDGVNFWGNWWWWWARGWFVSPDFAVDADEAVLDADDAWAVGGVSTDATNGLAFATLSAGDGCFVPMADIRTNAQLRGAVSFMNLTNAYADLLLAGCILGDAQGDVHEGVSALQRRETSGGGWSRYPTNYTYASYTYTDEQGYARTGSYMTGYSLGAKIDWASAATNEGSWAEGLSVSGSATAERTQVVDGKIAQAGGGTNEYELVAVGDPYTSAHDARAVSGWPVGTNRLSLSAHYCLSTGAVYRADLVDSVDFLAVLRLRCEYEEESRVSPGGPWSTTGETSRVVAFLRDPAAYAGTTNGYFVYRGSADVGALLLSAYDRCGGVPQVGEDEPTMPELPARGGLADLADRVSTIERRRTMTLDDLRVYPLIRRRYNAEFTMP